MKEKSNAVQVVDTKPGQIVESTKAPEVVLAEASRAAQALKGVLDSKEKKIIINGKRHLEFDDWQTVGRFYNLSVRTYDAVPFEVNGVKGAKARSEIIDTKSGIVVGGAESYCLSDEPRWAGKPFFQLASMAQTRAGSKAFSNALRWVVILAGYNGTPAEEMEGLHEDRAQQATVVSAPPPAATTITREPVVQSGGPMVNFVPVDVLDRVSKKSGKAFWKAIESSGDEILIFDAAIAATVKRAKLDRKMVHGVVETDSFGRVLQSARID